MIVDLTPAPSMVKEGAGWAKLSVPSSSRSATLLLMFLAGAGLRCSTSAPPRLLARGNVTIGTDDAEGQFALRHSLTLGTTSEPYANTLVYLNGPTGVTVDDRGAWLSEGPGRRLVKVVANVATDGLGVGGSAQGFEGIRAGFFSDVASGPQGELWVADASRHAVWKLDQAGHLLDSLGDPDGTQAGRNSLNSPVSVAVNDEGYVFVSDGSLPTGDAGSHQVVVFDPSGREIARIGEAHVAGSDSAHLRSPRQIALSPDRRLFIADSGNHRVQEFDVTTPDSPRYLSTFGAGVAGADDRHFDQPSGVFANGTFLYVADSANCRVQVLWRNNRQVWRTVGGPCGQERSQLRWPVDVATDRRGTIYVADYLGQRLVVFDNTYEYVTQLGVPGVPYGAEERQFNAPVGVARTSDGGTLVVERAGQRLVKLNPLGYREWVLGEQGLPGDDMRHLNMPADVAVGPDGTLYLSDTGNHRVLVLNESGEVLRSIGRIGGGVGEFLCPEGLASGPDGSLAVADPCNHRVQMFDLTLNPSQVIDEVDGTPLLAPEGVAFLDGQRLAVADSESHRVVIVDITGRLLDEVGRRDEAGSGFDRLDTPRRVAVGDDGHLYVSDSGNHRLQVFDRDGTYLTTVGGLTGGGSGHLQDPRGLALDHHGELYLADVENHRIQRFTPGVPGWRQENVNGFGHPGRTGIVSLASEADVLYAGTRPVSGLGQVWRRAGSDGWRVAAADGFGAPGNVGIGTLAVFMGTVYAGTENASEGAEVWRSTADGPWQRVVGAGFGSSGQTAITAMARFQDRLCAGTTSETVGAEVWCSASGEVGTWERRATAGFDAAQPASAVTALMSHRDALYAGSSDSQSGGRIWRSDDGRAWRAVSEPGFGTSFNQGVSALAVFSETLYAATTVEPDSGHGVEIWRCQECDGGDWQRVAETGTGDQAPLGPAALVVFAETDSLTYLYLTVNGPNGLEVWRTAEGTEWEIVDDVGLGDSLNDSGGPGAIVVHENRLYLGTRNAGHGAELWSTAGTRLEDPAGGSPPPIVPVRRAVGGAVHYDQIYRFPRTVPPAGSMTDDMFGQAAAMAVAGDGTVYILDERSSRVVRLNPDGTWGKPFGDGDADGSIAGATDIAVNSSSKQVYVSDYQAARILVYDVDGVLRDTWPGIAARSIDIDDSGGIWMVDESRDEVVNYDAGGRLITKLGQPGAEVSWPINGVKVSELATGLGDVLFVANQGIIPGDWRPYPPLRLTKRGATYQAVEMARIDRETCPSIPLIVVSKDVVCYRNVLYGDESLRVATEASRLGIRWVSLISYERRSGVLYGVGVYDDDPQSEADPTYPAVLRYVRNNVRVIEKVWLAKNLPISDLESRVQAVRLSTTAGQDLTNGLSLWSATGDLIGQAVNLVPDWRDHADSLELLPQMGLVIDRNRRIATLAVKQTLLQQGLVAVYGHMVEPEECRGKNCDRKLQLQPEWARTFMWLRHGESVASVRAVAYEPNLDQFLVLRTRAIDPQGRRQVTMLTAFDIEFGGRHTDLLLDGLPIDVDATSDGLIYVLDALGPSITVLNQDRQVLARYEAPADAIRVAGGARGQFFVLTRGGHVVRLDPSGQIRARFDARPHRLVPAAAVVDLATDDRDYVYVVDGTTHQVTAFAPRDFELGGDPSQACPITQDKRANPADLPLGDETTVTLRLNGSCGEYGEPTDVILVINTRGSSALLQAQLARMALGLVDLTRHRAAIVAYYEAANVVVPLTHDKAALLAGLERLDAPGRQSRILAGLQAADGLLTDPTRGQVIVMVHPEYIRNSAGGNEAINLATALRDRGVKLFMLTRDTATPLPEEQDLRLLTPTYQSVLSTFDLAGWNAFSLGLVPRVTPRMLVRMGLVTDQIPTNMRYVDGSALPVATWDPDLRMLSWPLTDVLPGTELIFTYRLVPQVAGLHPTNVQALAEFEDGGGRQQRLDFPVPKVRVYGFDTPTPTPTVTPTSTPSPTRTLTPSPTSTPEPFPVLLPLLLTERCTPGQTQADAVLVIDTSSSMIGAPLEGAKAAALEFLNLLRLPQDQVALVSFNSQSRVDLELTGDRQRAAAAIAALATSPGTRIELGLSTGLAELASVRRKSTNTPVLVLLTDGIGDEPQLAVETARQARAAGIELFVVGLGNDIDQDLLLHVAGAAGRLFLAPSPAELGAIYRRVAVEIPCSRSAFWSGR